MSNREDKLAEYILDKLPGNAEIPFVDKAIALAQAKNDAAKCFDALVTLWRDRGVDFFADETSVELCEVLTRHGFMRFEKYDPEGKHALIDCESEPGQMIWIWDDTALARVRELEGENG